MRIVLSKDRPAQLDLLLRSFQLAPPEPTAIVWTASTLPFERGYERLRTLYAPAPIRWLDDRSPPGFEGLIRSCVTIAQEGPRPTVTFLCDDGAFIREPPPDATAWLEHFPGVVCFSLRLGDNTTVCYPTGAAQTVPGGRMWRWADGEGDFGYPGSVDAHVFRAADVAAILHEASLQHPVGNPTTLELVLVAGCERLREQRPYMLRPRLSCYVGIPANRTSLQSGVRNSGDPELSAESLNERWLAGGRLTLEPLDLGLVDGAHAELPLRWSE